MKKLLTLLLSLFALATLAQVRQANVLSLQGFGGNNGVASSVSRQQDNSFIIGIGANSNVGNIDLLCTGSGDRIIFMKFNSDASILEWSKCYHSSFSDSGFSNMFST